MDGTTRINEAVAGFTIAPADFAAPFDNTLGALSGRGDEVYLQPDLWWDNLGIAPGSAPFPPTLAAVQGGMVATVADPGGFANLLALAAGDLGSGTALYRGSNGISGVGNYTLYYDAIMPVPPPPMGPPPPGGGGGGGGGDDPLLLPVFVPQVVFPPFIPDTGLFNFLFFSQTGADLFGYTDRDRLIMGDVVDGGGDATEGVEGEGRKPGWLWGVMDRVLTPEEEEERRRRRARYHFQVDNGDKEFWIYRPGSLQYSSQRLFGLPGSPSP